jgi:phage terminase small subunit
MKPQNFLTDTGKEIFKQLVKHVEKAGLMEIDSYRLSDLANAMDMVQRSSNNINSPKDSKQVDGVQITANGYTQVTGHVAVHDKYNKIVDTLGAKYGLTAADREKITAFAKKDNPDDEFSKL